MRIGGIETSSFSENGARGRVRKGNICGSPDSAATSHPETHKPQATSPSDIRSYYEMVGVGDGHEHKQSTSSFEKINGLDLLSALALAPVARVLSRLGPS